MFETQKGLWGRRGSFKRSEIEYSDKSQGKKIIKQEDLNGMKVGRQNGERNIRRAS